VLLPVLLDRTEHVVDDARNELSIRHMIDILYSEVGRHLLQRKPVEQLLGSDESGFRGGSPSSMTIDRRCESPDDLSNAGNDDLFCELRSCHHREIHEPEISDIRRRVPAPDGMLDDFLERSIALQ